MSDIAIEVRGTTAGLSRITRRLADEPLRPGFVSRAGRILLYAQNGRCLLIVCPRAQAALVRGAVRQATGVAPWCSVTQLGDATVLREYLSQLPGARRGADVVVAV